MGESVGQMSVKSRGPWQSVRDGSVVVPIYRVRARGVWSHVVTWYDGSRRQRKAISDPQEAIAHARRVAKALARHGTAELVLTGAELIAYRRARDVLRPLGVPVDVAAIEYAAARGRLGSMSLTEAVDRLLAAPGAGNARSCPPIAYLVDEFVAAKEGAGRSDAHVRGLRTRLGLFRKAFAGDLLAVRVPDVERWLESCGGAPRTRRNNLDALVALIRWAERRGYLTRGSVDLSYIELPREDGDVEIYTPDELQRLLLGVRADFIPFIALGAFAGLRTAEIERLEWEEITAEHIDIRPEKSKTRQRRLVPVLPALSAWIEPHRTDGRVCSLAETWRIMQQASQASGVEWQRNALRHSFGTYRMALVRNEHQVALEMGNTPAMIFRHYRAAASESEARRWFDLRQ